MKLEDVQDAEIKDAIYRGLIMRTRAYDLEQEVGQLKKDANDLLLPALITIDDMRVKADGFGTVTHVITERSKFDRDKFKLTLVRKGVKATLIEQAEEMSTTKTSTDSVRFMPWEGE